MAVVLTYDPQAEFLPMTLSGLAMAAVGMLLTTLELGGRGLRKLQDFRGYPMQAGSLAIPVLLASGVLLLHYLLPEVSILVWVSLLSISLTVALLYLHQRPSATRACAVMYARSRTTHDPRTWPVHGRRTADPGCATGLAQRR
ncbi:MAG: hypothetical protein R3E89_03805 [Thiolinea sp.]